MRLIKELPKIIIKAANPITQLRSKLKIAFFSPKIQKPKTLVLMRKKIIRVFLAHYKIINPKTEIKNIQLPTIYFT